MGLPNQRGTILIIALLVVAVITGLTVNFASDFQLSMKRAEQRLYSGQLNQYWFSIERFASWVLRQDKSDDFNTYGGGANVDHLGELWANSDEEKDFTFDFGVAKGVLEDAQGRFNLNQLATKLSKPNASSFREKYAPQHKRFIRLLQTQEDTPISVAEAEEITQAVIDWIDSDNLVTGVGGAENDFYLSKDEPYRAANRTFTSVTELRLIKGMTNDLYQHLKLLVVALPDTKAGINIHTALPEVMRTLNSPGIETPLAPAEGETLQASMPVADEPSDQVFAGPREGYKTAGAFRSGGDFAAVFGSNQNLWPPADGLSTGSQYFLLSTQMKVGNIERKSYSLLQRTSSNSGVIEAQVVHRGSEATL
ncbi:MAG: general secretion pathway protein K [Cellvibrionaceae bacterium]|jgi:general secretion pathway protein K